MIIRTGSDEEKQFILQTYPYVAQVMHQGGILIVAVEAGTIIGFL